MKKTNIAACQYAVTSGKRCIHKDCDGIRIGDVSAVYYECATCGNTWQEEPDAGQCSNENCETDHTL